MNGLASTARRAGVIATLYVLVALLATGCGGRDEIGPEDREDMSQEDTTDVEEDESLDTADTSVDMQPDEEDDVPSDFDPGPRELLNGTPVRFGHIIDGDTLDVFVGEQAVKVYTTRLKGLSAPECIKEQVLTDTFGRRYQCVRDDEYYGLASREALVDLVQGKEGYVTCDDVAVGEWCPTDQFDRYLIYVEVEGQDVATSMADAGAALSYTSFFASKRAQICEAEYDARGAGRGMWAASNNWADVINMMSSQTQNWYFGHHDERCDEALGL